MSSGTAYNRALLKLSGDALGGESGCFDETQLDFVAEQTASAYERCSQLGIVIGGGNIMRGRNFSDSGPRRLRADHAGMLATVVNALVFEDALEQVGVPSQVFSALPTTSQAREFDARACRQELSAQQVVILAGGTGNPLFTTDTAAALRAVQLEAEVLLKATRVKGVFSQDPEQEKSAQFFPHLSYQEILAKRLGVMDLCAVSLCMEHGIPVQVFDFAGDGNLRRAVSGESVGTLIE